MQIPPTSALLRALSSLPTAPMRPAEPTPSAAPVTSARASGALAAAERALAARASANTAPAGFSNAAPAALPAGEPPRNLPRGSIINIVV